MNFPLLTFSLYFLLIHIPLLLCESRRAGEPRRRGEPREPGEPPEGWGSERWRGAQRVGNTGWGPNGGGGPNPENVGPEGWGPEGWSARRVGGGFRRREGEPKSRRAGEPESRFWGACSKYRKFSLLTCSLYFRLSISHCFVLVWPNLGLGTRWQPLLGTSAAASLRRRRWRCQLLFASIFDAAPPDRKHDVGRRARPHASVTLPPSHPPTTAPSGQKRLRIKIDRQNLTDCINSKKIGPQKITTITD